MTSYGCIKILAQKFQFKAIGFIEDKNNCFRKYQIIFETLPF